MHDFVIVIEAVLLKFTAFIICKFLDQVLSISVSHKVLKLMQAEADHDFRQTKEAQQVDQAQSFRGQRASQYIAQGESYTCEEVTNKIAFEVMNYNFSKALDGLAGILWVLVVHEKVLDHIYDEANLHYIIKDGERAVIWLTKTGKECAQKVRNSC